MDRTLLDALANLAKLAREEQREHRDDNEEGKYTHTYTNVFRSYKHESLVKIMMVPGPPPEFDCKEFFRNTMRILNRQELGDAKTQILEIMDKHEFFGNSKLNHKLFAEFSKYGIIKFTAGHEWMPREIGQYYKMPLMALKHYPKE